MEATKLNSSGIGQRNGGGAEVLSLGIGAAVPGTGTPAFHRAERTPGVRCGGPPGRSLVGAVDYVGVRGRRRVSESAHPLDGGPAIGGLAIGVGGLIFPQALGVGYDTI